VQSIRDATPLKKIWTKPVLARCLNCSGILTVESRGDHKTEIAPGFASPQGRSGRQPSLRYEVNSMAVVWIAAMRTKLRGETNSWGDVGTALPVSDGSPADSYGF
jgi:hypothetical protein